MAGINTKYGNDYNQPIREYVVTSEAEVADLPTSSTEAKGKFKDDTNFKYKPAIGSICRVITADGSLFTYMLRENGWTKMKTSSSSSGSSDPYGDFDIATDEEIKNLFS